MRRFCFHLTCWALVLGTLPSTTKSVTASPPSVLQAAKKPFSWEGSCEIQCQDGTCKVFCSAGIGFATNSLDAKIQAEAALRSMAGKDGAVKEASLKVTIKGVF